MTEAILEQLNSIKIEYLAKKLVQDQEKDKSGAYPGAKKQKDENGIEYSVNAYLCPNGERGIDIIFYSTIENKEYTKSVCYGQEKESREHAWIELTNEI